MGKNAFYFRGMTRITGMRREWGLAVLWIAFIAGWGMGCGTPQTTPQPKEYSKTEKARMLVELANGALAERDATGPLQSLPRGEQLDDSLPELYHSRALAFYMKEDLEAALRAAKQAIEMKSDYADANNTLGKLLMDLGKPTEAEKYLKMAANDVLYREAYKAWTNLGILKYQAGHTDEARKSLSRAIQESPNMACVAYYYRGHVHMKTKQFKAAVEDYTSATKKICANFSDAYLALGLALQQNRQYPSARKVFVEIQRRYPNTKLAEQALDQLRYLP